MADTQENIIAMGKAFLRTNMLEKASDCFEEALDDEEVSHEALFYLGVISFKQQDYKKSVEMFKKLLEVRTDSVFTFNNLALSLEKCDRTKEAMLVYDAGLELTPASGLLMANRGVLKYKTGDYEGAVRDLSRALKKKPGIAFLYFYLGLALVKTERLTEARDYLEEALALAPGDVTILNNLGYLTLRSGLYSEARAYLKKAVRHAGGFRPSYLNLARLYTESGQLEMSLLMLHKAFPDDTTKISDHIEKLSAFLTNLGREEEARYLEQRALDLANGNSNSGQDSTI
jgi:tetratricopeptide (TPR) repeat protein